MLVHWIWLAVRPNMTDRAKLAAVQHFGDPEDLYFADSSTYAAMEGISPEGAEALADKNLHQAEEILRKCAERNIHILTYRDAAYPARLKNIPDPPMVLYYKGSLPDFDGSPLIAAVGTRHASAYGLGIAKRMGYQIARCGGIVVSGMAYGIDGMAMRGALTAGGQAVGVLGCGADVVYPRSNASLFVDVERYGCILTEFPPETEPVPWNFPKRNRIISGLSCGVLVVEAPEKSGALITARLAADQGRDVFVVPGNIDVDSCAGSNALLRDGAIAVSSGWDILSEYEALYPDKIRKDSAPSRQSGYPDEVRTAAENEKPLPKVAQKPRIPKVKASSDSDTDKKAIDNRAQGPYIDLTDRLSGLSETEQAIVKELRSGERLVDDVIAATGLPAGALLASLTLLEIKGIVTRLPGKRISLAKQKP